MSFDGFLATLDRLAASVLPEEREPRTDLPDLSPSHDFRCAVGIMPRGYAGPA